MSGLWLAQHKSVQQLRLLVYNTLMASVSEEKREKTPKNKRITNVGFFPVDPQDCDCFKEKKDLAQKASTLGANSFAELTASMKTLECPRSKDKGMKRYFIYCRKCGAKVARIHATNKRLSDWCNLHYINSHDRFEWKGCFSVQISPLDGKLGFECACGNDTRDHRLDQKKGKEYARKAVTNLIGREFGKKNSKFVVKSK